jgi:hypothetical protein
MTERVRDGALEHPTDRARTGGYERGTRTHSGEFLATASIGTKTENRRIHTLTR